MRGSIAFTLGASPTMPLPAGGRGRPLTPQAFARLLSRLGDDPEAAGREYDALHR